LTIPLFEVREDDPTNVKHRLLNPADPKDKYRPERSGIAALPFLGDRDLPIDAADRVIVVEGEIKAAVTFLTLDHNLWQVVGVPGKNVPEQVVSKLKDRKDTVIILDPDAKAEAVKLARAIGGAKVVDLAEKIDDMIIDYGLGKNWVESVLHNARNVV
jgi:hypothetical protein